MHRLLLIALLAAAACTSKPASTTPHEPPPPAVVDVAVTTDSLIAFFQRRFPAAVAAGTIQLDFGSGGVGEQVVQELAVMGISTTAQLAAIVPPDFDTKGIGAMAAATPPTSTIAGVIRDLLVIHDVRGYFTKAWNNSWTASGPADFPAPAAYGVDFAVMQELGAFGAGGDDEGNPCGGDDDDDDDGGGDPCGE